MSLDLINVGAEANDGTGDTPRAAGQKMNAAIAFLNALPAGVDYSAAIEALETAVADLETVQGTQAGAIAAAQAAADTKRPLTAATGTLAYAATVDLDLAVLTGSYQTITLTGNLGLTTSNRAAGREVSIRLLADASSRNLTFPAGWRFLGAARPASIAANKAAMLTVTFFGAADTDALCAYAVEL